MPCFPMFYPFFFCSRLMIRVIFSHACIALLAMLCSDLCVYVLFAMFCTQIRIRTCLYAWIHALLVFALNFICLHACFYTYMSTSMFSHAYVHGSTFSTCFFLYSMCLCTPCHVCMPRPRICLSCHVVLQPFCRFIFLSYILAYWFKPDLDLVVFFIVYTPWPTSKGLDNLYLQVYACLFLCFRFVLASLVLGFVMFETLNGFVVVWLHSTPTRPCLDVTIWDASPRCQLLHAYLSLFPLRVMICLPCLFVSLVGFLCIFTRLLTCPCMSLAYQCVIHTSTQ